MSFMPILKIQSYLIDKMPPRNFKITKKKKKKLGTKLENNFLIFTFWDKIAFLKSA